MKIKIKPLSIGLLAPALLAVSITVSAEEYTIDTEGMHASIQFRVAHLGYSWLYGRFNKFSGKFSYDESKPEKTTLEITIDTASVDSNHAERDKHLRGNDLLNVKKFPKANFVSTRYIPGKNGGGTLKGNFTLHGVTHPIEIAVTAIGAGADPWGGYRRGFEGSAKFAMADYGILKDLGPSSKNVELILSIEGVRVNK
ncbi:Protein yceI precursor [hydrothermal vent metagenome]|uniref:Protein yceI n=1 Tax=hydrothermal vent metagenome TaxID=652676 RepID=A0A3B0X2W5_9ZZZZ